ncbi:MAG TPA: helix-turn-helix transcriptional regulator [Solirubrobacterales bacterium]|nr:helix-turn-helix transcriptional regulator [Solirubrobacterales bacterium]
MISLKSEESVVPKDGRGRKERHAELQALRHAVGSAIRALRSEAKLSQKALAERSGLSKSWISRLESGQHEPTFESIRRLARGLGISSAELAKKIEDCEQS